MGTRKQYRTLIILGIIVIIITGGLLAYSIMVENNNNMICILPAPLDESSLESYDGLVLAGVTAKKVAEKFFNVYKGSITIEEDGYVEEINNYKEFEDIVYTASKYDCRIIRENDIITRIAFKR